MRAPEAVLTRQTELYAWLPAAGIAVAIGLLFAYGRPTEALVISALPLFTVLPPSPTLVFLISFLGFAPLLGSYYQAAVIGVTIAVAAVLVLKSSHHITGATPYVLAFVAFFSASLLWSDAPSGRALVALAPTLIILLGAVRWPLTQRRGLEALVGAGVVQSLITIFLATKALARVTALGPVFLPSTVAGGVAAAGLALSASGPSRRRLSLAFLLNVIAILLTETRGMIVGLLAGLLAIPLMSFSKTGVGSRLRKASFGLLLAGVVACVVLASTTDIADRYAASELDEGVSYRLEELETALLEIKSSPIIGHGVGHVFSNPIVGTRHIVNYLHNSVFYFAVTAGLVGAGLYLILIFQTIRLALKDNRDGLGAVVGGVVVSIFVFSLSAAIMRTLHFNLLLAFAAGIASPRLLRTA